MKILQGNQSSLDKKAWLKHINNGLELANIFKRLLKIFNCFISGLKHEIGEEICIFKSTTINQTIGLP